ncbi:MAG: hypothetical protein NC432_00955 [Roseburia sp.]|nr:hypothetical protein [Roseburia sp.]MCM1098293.1 hypothetical protein [Ruminococcus flavefaciens]
MQLGGIGGSHSGETHQVTNCMHSHEHYQKEPGGAAASSAQLSARAFEMQNQQQDAQMSLSAWLQKLMRSGRGFLRGVWGGSEAVGGETAVNGDRTGEAQAVLAESGRRQDTRESAARREAVETNPYFLAVGTEEPRGITAPLQKLRAKVRSVTGQLAGKLPGRFFRFQAKNSFQARPDNKPKEDLRKRSKYRKDELEIDCILTDESYLMDSYDRKGEYSQLTTKK